MADETPRSVPRLDFRKRLISPSVKDAMEAASAVGREAPLVHVIISPKESVDHPRAKPNRANAWRGNKALIPVRPNRL